MVDELHYELCSGPTSVPQKRAHATTGKGAAEKGEEGKGNVSGNKYNLFGNSA